MFRTEERIGTLKDFTSPQLHRMTPIENPPCMLVILKWAGYLGKFPGVGSLPPKRGGLIRTELTEEIKQPEMEGPNLTGDLPIRTLFLSRIVDSSVRDFTEQMVSVAGNQAIDEIGERLDDWDREDSRKKPPSPQPRKQREKGIEPLLNNPIRLYQERHVWAARSVRSPQRALRLLALIRNQPNRLRFILSSQSFKSFLCRHTETALAVVDQETAS